MNNICDECETVAHCLENGCIPKQPLPPPENCRQRLMAAGEAYPKSSCASCGSLSPKWRECDAALNSEVLLNGLTRAETDATASVTGLTRKSNLTERQEKLIADAVTQVLVAGGIVNSDVPLTWPHILLALEDLEKTIQREPLTDEEIWKNDEIMAANSGYGATFDALREVIRATERAHMIGVV